MEENTEKYYFHSGTEAAINAYNERLTNCCSVGFTRHVGIDEETGKRKR